MATILLVEDDPVLGEGLKLSLESEDYIVEWAKNLADAQKKNSDFPLDLVLLDISLPDGRGIEFCRQLRDNASRLPIIMLTAEVDEDTVVEAFDAGATDYVKKPFSHRELTARIRAALNVQSAQSQKLRAGDLVLLLEKREAFLDGVALPLNRREFDLMLLLARRADSVVTRDALLENLDHSEEISDRTIDSHVSHIRTKIKATKTDKIRIKSEYGVGYRLVTKW